jgi:hypothetical protein
MSEQKEKITYADIKEAFSQEDLTRYDALCKELVTLTRGKDKAELWQMAQPGQKMREVLDEIHALRAKYDFLKNEKIFRVWKFNSQTKQMDELTW